MTNPHPYKIKPYERGHRAPLSFDESTVRYCIELRASVRQRLRTIGTKRVRALLDAFAENQVRPI